MRVVSLLPSATELVCLVGGTDYLVGRSHECDHPPAIRDRPVLTGAKNPFTSCEQMNKAVTTTLATGEGLYTIDAGLLRELAPDVIVTQSLCAVCSVDLRLVEEVVAGMAAAGGAGAGAGGNEGAAAPSPPAPDTPGGHAAAAAAAAAGGGSGGDAAAGAAAAPAQQQQQQQQQRQPRIVSLNPFTIEEVLGDALAVGEALGLQQQAARAVAGLRARVEAARALVASLPPLRHPTVAFLEWAGGGAGPSYAVYNDELVALDPDWIIICPCGLDIRETLEQLPPLVASGFWRHLKAVREGRVVLVDGNAMFNRPGPRLVDCLEFLVGLLHDRHDVIPPGFPWRPLGADELAGPVAAWLEAHPGWETRVQQGPKPAGQADGQAGGGNKSCGACCGPPEPKATAAAAVDAAGPDAAGTTAGAVKAAEAATAAAAAAAAAAAPAGAEGHGPSS